MRRTETPEERERREAKGRLAYAKRQRLDAERAQIIADAANEPSAREIRAFLYRVERHPLRMRHPSFVKVLEWLEMKSDYSDGNKVFAEADEDQNNGIAG